MHSCYQVAALLDDMPTSIFDGVTTYPLGLTVYQEVAEDHQGGLYCHSTVSDCVLCGSPNSSSLCMGAHGCAWHIISVCMVACDV
jgi:hypothetical protein